MTNEQICERLNSILALELSGTMMYLHYSYFIYGHSMIPIVGWLREQANKGVAHATLVGDKITSLGGTPRTFPATDKFPWSFDTLNDMLRAALHLEKEAWGAYADLLRDIEALPEHLGLRLFLEMQIQEETGHIEQVEKMLKPDIVH